MALLRDVPFTQFDTNPQVAMAASELAGLSEFTGKVNNTVTPQTIFRGCEAGNLQGPFISQFLFKDIPYGALYGSLIPPQPQKMRTVLGEAAVGVGNADYMTTVQDWLDVQNGKMIFPFDMYDSTPRYIRNMRDLGEYVHVDALYEAYLNACLILLGMMASVDMGNPYRPPNTASTNQIGFGTFGGPHILSLVTEVATRALKVVWYQKWQMHRRLRPEAYGGLVHFKKTGQKPIYPIPPQVLGSQAVAQTQAKFGTYLLPMEFQEGSPTHPSYGAGHATVAGACVTVLKAFFDENAPMPSPVVPTPDGLTLLPYTGSDAGSLTVGGELNKVAANIAIGRNMAGVHWRSDYYQSLRLGERVAICILYNQRKDYHEDYSFTFTSFDGETVTISRNGVDGLDHFRPCRDKG
jgi:membrane-associated phospholipid phosphatase